MICVMKFWGHFLASVFIVFILVWHQSTIGCDQDICFDSALKHLVCVGKYMLFSAFAKVFTVSRATEGTIYQRLKLIGG
ncbi:hypothetical protein BDV33DRAFT_47892 [Aspergillus novoparasiticus]|uniref:Uncharacterized protein n=1 Tax=Aspergillus novoparasiticus TaxID=986946 RepID=A0A5N6EZU6_9EURO|nr:hypothetical protein BDV33DRAFT_47892 [Aspergillus novoparasiticus]